MKIKNLFAILLAQTLLICTFIIPVSAENSKPNNIGIDIVIYNDVSNETKEKIEKYFATGEPALNNNTSTYGITCTLLGHKLENSIVDVITHKASATAPRCLKKTYEYSACTRCDYETSEVILKEYIYCCA